MAILLHLLLGGKFKGFMTNKIGFVKTYLPNLSQYLPIFITLCFSLGVFAGFLIGTAELKDPVVVIPDYGPLEEDEVVSFAVSDYGSIRIYDVRSVYDGDTFKVTIPGWPKIIGDTIGIRISGIDTPERIGTSEDIKMLAAEARQAAIDLLEDADIIELRNMRRGKYFRIVADVYVDDELFADILIDKKLAKPYDGGTRPTWTSSDLEEYYGNSTETAD